METVAEENENTTFTFIDASNLFYGGELSLGWKVDYSKLAEYLKSKYRVSKIYYFGGIETHNLDFDYISNDSISIEILQTHISEILDNSQNEERKGILKKHLQTIKFYKKLASFGYTLILKPVKTYYQNNERVKKKANCDVDMTFYMMKELENFNSCIILSGDGDFLPVLKHIKSKGKEVTILGRGKRTAKEIKQFAGSNFRDFEYLRELIKVNE